MNYRVETGVRFKHGRASQPRLRWRAVLPAIVALLAIGVQPAAASCEATANLQTLAEHPDAVVFAGTIAAISDDRSLFEVSVTTWFFPAELSQATMRVSTGSGCDATSCTEGSESITGGAVGVAMIFPGTWAGGDAPVEAVCPYAQVLENGTSPLFEEAADVFGLPETDAADHQAVAVQPGGVPTGLLITASLLSALLALMWLTRDADSSAGENSR